MELAFEMAFDPYGEVPVREHSREVYKNLVSDLKQKTWEGLFD